MTASRDGFPAHTTISRTTYPDAKPFAPPQPPRHSRTVAVGSTGCTLTQEIFDDNGPVEDAHYSPVDRHREREAARLTQEARDSILRPAHLADRGDER